MPPRTAARSSPPGTVSRILWHFTGGPRWLASAERQSAEPKPAKHAYANLKSILQTRKLRLGAYREIVRIVLSRVRRFDRKKRRTFIRRNVPVSITSKPICCLSDIPAQHLGYHAYRYGKFAIGFHRQAAVNHGFNPVLYSLQTTGVVRSIYDGFSGLGRVNVSQIAGEAAELITLAGAVERAEHDLLSAATTIESEADYIGDAVFDARDSLEEFIAFVKTFANNEFDTIYCEREWRALNAFRFSWSDVAMIVLPRARRRCYFDDFTQNAAPQLQLPRSIPIVAWEDLVEH